MAEQVVQPVESQPVESKPTQALAAWNALEAAIDHGLVRSLLQAEHFLNDARRTLGRAA
jgi:hypothetical protein